MKKILFAILVLANLAPAFVPAVHASALSGSEFQAGSIIDDGVFFNGNTMSSADIQAFMNAKLLGGSCDTNGTQAYAGTTAAQYSTARGYAPPYTCLNGFRQAVSTINSDDLCSGLTAGDKSAAQIIFEVARSCSINPKVILVLLQKEQSLVTDNFPWSIQYDAATGYACPDTASCDPEFKGFYKQVYYGARQFKRYARDVNSFRYKAYRDNYIQYNPNSGCGGSNVFLQNQATAGLYIYTPYQPNQAALSNLYGTGDGCSAYGNRNFWRLFKDWFGSTTGSCTFPGSVTNGIYRLYNAGTGNHLLTTSPSEVCAATSIGWMYDGQMFMADPDGVPVYRLERGGRYLYTSSAIERDNAISQYGYRLEGTAFNGVNPATKPDQARAVYRLANTSNGTYAYTISDYERAQLVALGYRYDGPAFYLQENSGTAVAQTYRLSHPKGIYLYTLSATERDNAASYYGYRYEGVGFNAITQMNQITIPIYRLSASNGYLLTTSIAERISAKRLGYRDEGIAMYTYGVNDDSLTKIFRLSHPNGTYLYTASSAERDSAVQSYGYRYEGVGFRAP